MIFLHDLNNKKSCTNIVFIWFTRGNKDFFNELNELNYPNVTFVIIDTLNKKRPTIDKIFEDYINFLEADIICCGPLSLVDKVEELSYKKKYGFHRENFLI